MGSVELVVICYFLFNPEVLHASAYTHPASLGKVPVKQQQKKQKNKNKKKQPNKQKTRKQNKTINQPNKQ